MAVKVQVYWLSCVPTSRSQALVVIVIKAWKSFLCRESGLSLRDWMRSSDNQRERAITSLIGPVNALGSLGEFTPSFDYAKLITSYILIHAVHAQEWSWSSDLTLSKKIGMYWPKRWTWRIRIRNTLMRPRGNCWKQKTRIKKVLKVDKEWGKNRQSRSDCNRLHAHWHTHTTHYCIVLITLNNNNSLTVFFIIILLFFHKIADFSEMTRVKEHHVI